MCTWSRWRAAQNLYDILSSKVEGDVETGTHITRHTAIMSRNEPHKYACFLCSILVILFFKFFILAARDYDDSRAFQRRFVKSSRDQCICFYTRISCIFGPKTEHEVLFFRSQISCILMLYWQWYNAWDFASGKTCSLVLAVLDIPPSVLDIHTSDGHQIIWRPNSTVRMPQYLRCTDHAVTACTPSSWSTPSFAIIKHNLFFKNERMMRN